MDPTFTNIPCSTPSQSDYRVGLSAADKIQAMLEIEYERQRKALGQSRRTCGITYDDVDNWLNGKGVRFTNNLPARTDEHQRCKRCGKVGKVIKTNGDSQRRRCEDCRGVWNDTVTRKQKELERFCHECCSYSSKPKYTELIGCLRVTFQECTECGCKKLTGWQVDPLDYE